MPGKKYKKNMFSFLPKREKGVCFREDLPSYVFLFLAWFGLFFIVGFCFCF